MLFGREGAESSHLDDELSFHLERQIDENIAAGMPRRSSAIRRSPWFGNPALLREQAYRLPQSWSSPSNPSFVICASEAEPFCARPTSTLIAIFVMALGLGANVALFTIVRGVLRRPLPKVDPGRLIMLYESEHATSARTGIRTRRCAQLLRLAEVLNRRRADDVNGLPVPEL